MSFKVEILPLTSTESFNELVLLSKEFFFEYEQHHEYFFKIDKIKDADISSYFTTFLNKNNRIAYIAKMNNKIVGYITISINTQPMLWHIKQVGHISGLMVTKSERKKGIAKLLLNKAIEYFQAKGIQEYTVYTSTNNKSALAFYEKVGMQPLYNHFLGKIE